MEEEFWACVKFDAAVTCAPLQGQLDSMNARYAEHENQVGKHTGGLEGRGLLLTGWQHVQCTGRNTALTVAPSTGRNRLVRTHAPCAYYAPSDESRAAASPLAYRMELT